MSLINMIVTSKFHHSIVITIHKFATEYKTSADDVVGGIDDKYVMGLTVSILHRYGLVHVQRQSQCNLARVQPFAVRLQ